LAPRSCPSKPGLAMSTRIFLGMEFFLAEIQCDLNDDHQMGIIQHAASRRKHR
jgi:hypothetical protein